MKRNFSFLISFLMAVLSLSACQLSGNKKLADNVISETVSNVLDDNDASRVTSGEQYQEKSDADGDDALASENS